MNSVPKAGTNLLAKAVGLFPGISASGLHIGYATLGEFAQSGRDKLGAVRIGIDWPQETSLSAVAESLHMVGKGHYATGHVPFAEELAAVMVEMGMKSILILRDPRDVVVSHANYVAANPTHFLFKFYQGLSRHQRIMTSITGIEPSTPGGPLLLSINERYRIVLPWASWSCNHTTYFEKLVGSQGGGSPEAQLDEIDKIRRHLNIGCSARDIKRVAQQTFGGTRTFMAGMGGRIGSWRDQFTEEHKSLFKSLAGRMLVQLGYEDNNDW